MATVTIIISDREDAGDLDIYVSSDGSGGEMTTAEQAAQFMVTTLSGHAESTNVTVLNTPEGVL